MIEVSARFALAALATILMPRFANSEMVLMSFTGVCVETRAAICACRCGIPVSATDAGARKLGLFECFFLIDRYVMELPRERLSCG